MIVEISNPSKYGKFFLAFEADGEEPERRNVKVVNVEPNRVRKDFNTVGSDDTGTEEPTVDAANDTSDDEPEGGDQDFNDVGSDDEDTGTDEPTEDDGTTDEEEEPEDGDQDFNDVGEDNEETSDESNDTADNTSDDEPEGEDQDFNDVGNSDSSDDSSDDNASDDKESNGPGLEYDSTRKFKLFQEFMSLYNAIENYISKLNFTIKDDMYENNIYKNANNKLREIQELVFDYMNMKFQVSSYVQSLLFYQKMVTATQLVFKLIYTTTVKNKK